MNLARRFCAFFRRSKLDREMDDELRFHIEEQTRRNVAAGMSPDEAARGAQKQFGWRERIHMEAHEERGWMWPENLARDFRVSLRALRRSPGFTATALATLAICVGANLTIFAVVDTILLRPLPFADPERLVLMFNSYPKAGKERDEATLTNYYERRGNIPAFSSLSALRYGTAIVGSADAPHRLDIARVSAEFFNTLGVEPVIGRVFEEEEMTYATDQVALLTDSFWRKHFNADPNVLGQEFRMDGQLIKVVGVLPANFRFLSSQPEIFRPLSSNPWERAVLQRYNTVAHVLIARLKPGISVSEAQTQVATHDAAHAAEFPEPDVVAAMGHRTIVAPLRADHVAAIRPTLILLQIGALLLLLIGTVNLVNLLLIRASARAKEFAIRQSLGAGRRHVVSQVLVETVSLTAAGGLGGLAVGAFGTNLMMALGADRLPLGAQIHFDAQLAAVAWLGSIALGVFIALPVAWFGLHTRLAPAMQSGTRAGTASRAAQRLRHGFCIAQIALAFVLLTGASLLGISLERAMAVSPGFRSDHLLTGAINLPWNGYQDNAATVAFADRLLDSLDQQPGVSAAGIITNLPVHRENLSNFILNVAGYEPAPGVARLTHLVHAVTGNYFGAMGIPLLAGRFLDATDSHRAERACVIDEDFARHYWPDGNALGQHVFNFSGKHPDTDAFTVVGIVGNVKHAALTDHDAPGAIYFPLIYHYFTHDFFVVVRTSLPPETFALTLRRIVHETDPELPFADPRSMDDRIAESLIARRSPALVASIFAAVALLLATIGLYGVMAYAVAQRASEFGIRMALGAQRADVLRLVLVRGTRLIVVGLIGGAAGTLALSGLMRSLLFNVSSSDPLTLAGVAAFVAGATTLACLIPACRATRVDPMFALRAE